MLSRALAFAFVIRLYLHIYMLYVLYKYMFYVVNVLHINILVVYISILYINISYQYNCIICVITYIEANF